jgi:hypothetical protein
MRAIPLCFLIASDKFKHASCGACVHLLSSHRRTLVAPASGRLAARRLGRVRGGLGAVPPIRAVRLFVLVLELIAHQRKPKVADAKAALTTHKDVTGLQIAVENVGGGETLQGGSPAPALRAGTFSCAAGYSVAVSACSAGKGVHFGRCYGKQKQRKF